MTIASASNELATIKFRYKKPHASVSNEIVTEVSHTPTRLGESSNDFKFASAVAWFGLKLRDSKYMVNKDSEAILALAKKGIQQDTEGYKSEFVRLVASNTSF